MFIKCYCFGSYVISSHISISLCFSSNKILENQMYQTCIKISGERTKKIGNKFAKMIEINDI